MVSCLKNQPEVPLQYLLKYILEKNAGEGSEECAVASTSDQVHVAISHPNPDTQKVRGFALHVCKPHASIPGVAPSASLANTLQHSMLCCFSCITVPARCTDTIRHVYHACSPSAKLCCTDTHLPLRSPPAVLNRQEGACNLPGAHEKGALLDHHSADGLWW